MTTARQERKAEAFRALHAGQAFLIPNPWDAGSARVLEALGFEALATTSSGYAFTLGRLDGGVTLDEVVEHTASLDGATELPLSVDLENGYGASPDAVALAITRVAAAGAVSVDRGLRRATSERGQAVERIIAAAEAAVSTDSFTLTARARTTSVVSRIRGRSCAARPSRGRRDLAPGLRADGPTVCAGSRVR
jgi:2-methylisocitrate lyase-like PEP mutase family enzyme